MNKIYLDSASTTPVCQAAKEAAISAMDNFGNPSSMHQLGLDAERMVSTARATIAKIINAKPSEIYFTSSGTEANNMAILGGAKMPVGAGIITTRAEHPSIKAPVLALEQKGFKMFHVEHFGDKIDPRGFAAHFAPVSLVSIYHVHNETGTVQDIAALAKIIRAAYPGALFHVDAVQGFCKLPIDVRAWDVDMLSISAHKIGGLKGCGALYVRDGVHVAPLMLGGGQESGYRSGTENVPGIVAMAAAASQRFEKMCENYDYVTQLKERFIKTIAGAKVGIDVNCEDASPYILNISISGVRPEVLLNALSAQGIYISAGAACSNNKKQKKEDEMLLMAFGLSGERAQTAVRISFSAENTIEEIDFATKAFAQCVINLQKIRRLR